MTFQVRRIVDLSHPISADTQVYPGDPVPQLSAATTIDRDGYNVLHVSMGSQTGTHVDAPYHFLADGARIDAMELSMFLGPAVVGTYETSPRDRRFPGRSWKPSTFPSRWSACCQYAWPTPTALR